MPVSRTPPLRQAAPPVALRRSSPLKRRAYAILRKIIERALPQRDKNQRLMRPARPVSFDIADLVAWLEAKSEGGRGEVWRCRYCGLHLAIEDLELDHAEPLARGGHNDLANLRISCKPDNLQKGELTEDEYTSLREGIMNSYGTKAQQIIFSALRLAAMGRRLRFHPRKKKGTDDHDKR